MNAIEIRDLSVGYSRKNADSNVLLSGLNLSVAQGEMIAVIGANGAGKSSLLRILAGLQEPFSGGVEWFGTSVPGIPVSERPRRTASLFRGFARAEGITVRDLVELGRHPYTGMFGRLKEEDRAAVERAMYTTGILDFAERQVTTLSDGEFQKTMIAKMLAQDAPVMLLDEPATHLDLPASIELLQLLKKLTSREGKTVIFSTHNIALAFRLVEKILLLDGKGSFAAGTPEELSHHALMCGFLRTDRVRVENGNLIYNFEDHEN